MVQRCFKIGMSALTIAVISSNQACAKDLKWTKTYAEAIALAKKTDKLVMVDFYTDWCTWCKRLDADTYPSKEVAKVADQFVSLKLNAEKEGAPQAKKFGVTGFPTILFINKDGEVESKIGGYMPAGPFAGKMKEIAAAHREFPGLLASVKANPSDVNNSTKLAALYVERGNYSQVDALLASAAKANPGDTSGKQAGVNLQMAEAFAENSNYAKALNYFVRASKTARTDEDKVLSNIGSAVCYFQTGKKKQAAPYVQYVLKAKNVPDRFKTMAQQMQQELAKK